MLLTAEALYERLQDADVVVFDCRFQLGDAAAGRTQYLAGHIPGAYYLDLEQDLSGPVSVHGGRHPLPDPAELAAKLAAAGVTESSQVVVYDVGGGMAPRAWWLIRYLGHDRCAVLDGGFSAWQRANLPVETDVPAPKPGHLEPRVRHDWIVSTADVEAAMSGRLPLTLVDARAPERYRGDVEPLDPVAGHIPGAHNRPWTDGVRADGTWKSAAEQAARFAGLVDTGIPVMYCGSGVTACANLFALALAGVSGAKLYPGSWSDWCSYPEHPVATGEG
ncbi:thiosulfate sulfurtransferase [Alicyclobacillus contaminans]|nr:thiosulfate sulfurtransferase [Alicyclobacillus contaminans]